MGRPLIDLSGKQFGRLLVINRIESPNIKKPKWKCICECGTVTYVCGYSLKRGYTKSCGCLAMEVSKRHTHGLSNTPTYKSWRSMKLRCLNEKDPSYHRYGGAGVKIHTEWINSFESFYSYIGERPSLKHTLDRFPNNKGDYVPGNVRWGTPKQQGENKSSNKVISYNGKEMILADWAKELGMKPHLLGTYLNKGYDMVHIVAHEKYKRDNNLTKWKIGASFD